MRHPKVEDVRNDNTVKIETPGRRNIGWIMSSPPCASNHAAASRHTVLRHRASGPYSKKGAMGAPMVARNMFSSSSVFVQQHQGQGKYEDACSKPRLLASQSWSPLIVQTTPNKPSARSLPASFFSGVPSISYVMRQSLTYFNILLETSLMRHCATPSFPKAKERSNLSSHNGHA